MSVPRTVWLAPAFLVGVNGLNFLYFLLLARSLDLAEFTRFSYAVSIVAFAMAIAEAGVVYVAPSLLRACSSVRAARVTGGFLLLSYAFLVLITGVLTVTMSLLRQDELSGSWLVTYLFIVAPNILLQPWVMIRFRQAFAAAANACRKLEEAFAAEGLKFSRTQFEVLVNDRALAPNTPETRTAFESDLQASLKSMFGHEESTLEFHADGRRRVGAVVTTSKPSW